MTPLEVSVPECSTASLYEDWQARRVHLAGSLPRIRQNVQLQEQVLDYLLDRYQDEPAARRPAMFPLRKPLEVNDRAILVHRHLGMGRIAGVQCESQAHARVSRVLRRMASSPESQSDRAVGMEFDYSAVGERESQRPPGVSAEVWLRAIRAERPLGGGLTAIAEALAASPFLPRSAMEYLCRILGDPHLTDLRAAFMLARCQGPFVEEYAKRALRARLTNGTHDAVARKLESILVRQDLRIGALEAARAQLASPMHRLRLSAVSLLDRIGTLDDVGLLADLSSLPAADAEALEEREAMLTAMRRIARRGEN